MLFKVESTISRQGKRQGMGSSVNLEGLLETGTLSHDGKASPKQGPGDHEERPRKRVDQLAAHILQVITAICQWYSKVAKKLIGMALTQARSAFQGPPFSPPGAHGCSKRGLPESVCMAWSAAWHSWTKRRRECKAAPLQEVTTRTWSMRFMASSI